jgi:hypothetical protein
VRSRADGVEDGTDLESRRHLLDEQPIGLPMERTSRSKKFIMRAFIMQNRIILKRAISDAALFGELVLHLVGENLKGHNHPIEEVATSDATSCLAPARLTIAAQPAWDHPRPLNVNLDT